MFHQPFYPQQQQFYGPRGPTNFFTPLYRPGAMPNRSNHNLNYTRDFERFPTPPSQHGFASMPSGGYPFFDATNHIPDQHQYRWRHNMARAQQQQQHRRTPAFHFQDKSTSYFMTDPIVTGDDRITIQLTKVHIGPTGDQQRVFVEQDFSNEGELNRFVRDLRHNFEKAFKNNRSGASSGSASNENTDETNSTHSKKPGVVVVEEPDEEPKIYQQQAYNAKIESKRAAAAAAAQAASVPTPPLTPPMEETTPPPPPPPPPPSAPKNSKSDHRSRTHRRRTSSQRHRRSPNRAKYVSPPASPMSSSSTNQSSSYPQNKTKYRRQSNNNSQEEQPKEPYRPAQHLYRGPRQNNRNGFGNHIPPPRFVKTPSFARPYEPPQWYPQQRFFSTESEFRMRPEFSTPPNANFQWRYNQPPNGYRNTTGSRSRSHVPGNGHHTPFQHNTDPFFRPIHPPTPPRFAHHRSKDFRSPQSPTRLRRPNYRRQYPASTPRPTTIAENLVFPNQNEQQPRVHRTRSECRQAAQLKKQQQRHRSRSTAHKSKSGFLDCGPSLHFYPGPPPVKPRHFPPFRSSQISNNSSNWPFMTPSASRSTAPMFYPTRRPFGSGIAPMPMRLMNPYLGSHRF